MKKTRIVLIAVLIAAVPVTDHLRMFSLGARSLPYGYVMVYGIFFFKVLVPFIGIATAILAPMRRILHRVLLGFGACVLTIVLGPCVGPAPIVTYSHGLEDAMRKDPGIPRLQHWAEEALRESRVEGRQSTNKPSHWNPGDVIIPSNSLPAFLTTGVFRTLNVPNFGPEISVCTNGGRFGVGGECVAIAWYEHGFLIGPPEFRCEWNPWYCEQIAPGVYSYINPK